MIDSHNRVFIDARTVEPADEQVHNCKVCVDGLSASFHLYLMLRPSTLTLCFVAGESVQGACLNCFTGGMSCAPPVEKCPTSKCKVKLGYIIVRFKA